jgi:hypothetical protein
MAEKRFQHYLASLPERVLRSATAVAGGLLQQTGELAIPASIRRTRLYRSLVEMTLRFLVERIGQVDGVFPGEEKLADDFLIRRTAGNGLELAGILVFRASPVWVLAALADVSGAGRHLIQEITAKLSEEGLLEPGARFETVDELLNGLERTSARMAEAINTPPLDVQGLRDEWQQIRKEARTIPVPDIRILTENWRHLQQEASAQNRSLFEVSSLLALSAVRSLPERVRWLGKASGLAARRGGEVLGANLLGHYDATLKQLRQTGFRSYLAQEMRPYLRAAARQFSPGHVSSTERWLDRRANH